MTDTIVPTKLSSCACKVTAEAKRDFVHVTNLMILSSGMAIVLFIEYKKKTLSEQESGWAPKQS